MKVYIFNQHLSMCSVLLMKQGFLWRSQWRNICGACILQNMDGMCTSVPNCFSSFRHSDMLKVFSDTFGMVFYLIPNMCIGKLLLTVLLTANKFLLYREVIVDLQIPIKSSKAYNTCNILKSISTTKYKLLHVIYNNYQF